mgnify:FL=1|jgi:uncharacterized coiled-coil DUF342 family protein|nr:MAG TPA: chromosome segregation protein [Caudoviricetes sp.]
MASHSELRPDDAALPLLIASAALSKAESRITVATGTVVADNADGTQTWIGSNGSDDTSGVIKWVGDLSAPGRPLGLAAACSMQCVVVSWDGTLENGVPSDFAYIEVFARREGSVDDVVSWGRLSSAGMLMSPRYDIGTVFDVYAIAYDDAHDSTGALARNRSEQSDLITVAVEQDADMEQIDAAVEEMSKKADEAGAKAEQVRKDMQSEVDNVQAKVDGLSNAGDRLSGQIADIKGTVNGQQSKLDEFGQKLEGVVTQNGATVNSVTELRQTVSGLDARVSQNTETAEGAMSKATAVQQTADGIKTTLSKDYTSTKDADEKYSTKTELATEAGRIRAELSETTKTANGAMDKSATLETTVNGISTKISEQATKLDSTVKTANEAKSTADSNKTTISQVSTTASNALSKATTVESSLNGFKTTVSETYQTKADMSTYSTKSYVDETSKSVALGVVQDYKGADGSGLATKTDISVSRTEITSEVSNTYATKTDVTKEISSKITQNNSSLEVKFSNAGSIEYVTNGSFRENLDGWTVDDGQWVLNGGDNALQYYKAVSAGAKTLGPRQDPSVLMGTSTRQRLIRRSFDIANYSNASGATLHMSCRLNDGTWSGGYPSVELDSTFDWMHVDMVETIPAGKYIDRVVPVIRATNACTVNVEVRNFSLRDITDSYKSADAVINMTGQGVRVGKNKNGAWTGMSALVGTDATFDVLDTSGKRLLEVSATGVKFPHSKDGTRLALGYVAGSGSASDTLYIGDIITGQQEGGPKNRLGFTGDEVSLEGGDININASDNQLSLYGRKGANLLVPDGGNVQVGGQSGTSNTTLTLRGSTVNLSGGLVNVNGRTLNAPVDAKQSQRWDNIQLDVKCVNRVVTVNVLHPLGSNAIIGDPSDQCEIGYIKEGYRPSRMIGCHLAAYNTTNLFLEINPATGKVACFRRWGNQDAWAYFSASLSYVI